MPDRTIIARIDAFAGFVAGVMALAVAPTSAAAAANAR